MIYRSYCTVLLLVSCLVLTQSSKAQMYACQAMHDAPQRAFIVPFENSLLFMNANQFHGDSIPGILNSRVLVDKQSNPDAEAYLKLAIQDISKQEDWTEINGFTLDYGMKMVVVFSTFRKKKKMTRFFSFKRLEEGVQTEWSAIPIPDNIDLFKDMYLNGNMLYLSGKETGATQFDLYTSAYDGSTWSTPAKIDKPGVNSASDEVRPFAYKNKRLYFASNRSGQFDIHYVDLLPSGVQKVQHFTQEVNSDKNEMFMWTNGSLKMTFFVREDGLREDGLNNTVMRCVSPELNLPQNCTNYCFEFYDEMTTEQMNNSFVFEWDFGDGTKGYGNFISHCYEKAGAYTYALKVTDTVFNKVYEPKSTYTLEVNMKNPLLIRQEPVAGSSKVILSPDFDQFDKFEVYEYFWNVGGTKAIMGEAVLEVDPATLKEDRKVTLSVISDPSAGIRSNCTSVILNP